MLVQHLPLESATQTARLALMTDADFAATAAGKHAHGPWSHADLLLASVVDAVNRLIYVQMRRAGDTTAPLPEPLPRPGLRAGNVRAINQKAVAYLNNLRARGA